MNCGNHFSKNRTQGPFNHSFGGLLGVILILCTIVSGSSHAEQFAINIGDLVAPGQPGAGAGSLESNTAADTYTFTATAGQNVFLEEVSAATAFAGYLNWDIRSPSGVTVFSDYLDGRNHPGRKTLSEAGTYTLRVRVLANNPSYLGDYSFRLRAVPPDDTFNLQIGDSVSNNIPAPGAGNIEVPGAQDIYYFEATAGQQAFFEQSNISSAFKGYLQWEVKSPGGQTVFRSYMGSTPEGKRTLPETGKYTMRVWAGLNELGVVGTYAFLIRPIASEQVFSIQIGQVVSNGIPAAGAGNIEMAGAADRYTFEGTAGQSVFFDNLAADSRFKGWLQWQTRTPSGQMLFSTYFGTAKVGRKTLPETGTYSISVAAGLNDASMIGTYAFQITPISDSQIAIGLGDLVGDGVPAPGAGKIEEAGGQDLYRFQGTAGQRVVFEQISVSGNFGGYLRWRITTPSSNELAVAYFETNRQLTRVLPETGSYTIRVWPDISNPQAVGTYSFRTRAQVFAWPDNFVAEPGKMLVVPKARLLCNDRCHPVDALALDLPRTTSMQGGTLSEGGGAVSYTPPAGFMGQDTFVYRIRGNFGGEATNTATVRVFAGAEQGASVVSHRRTGNDAVEVCLLGLPSANYAVEESTDTAQWNPVGELMADAEGSMSYTYTVGTDERKFYRFRKK